MSIQAKQLLIKDIRSELGDYLPENQSDKVVQTINDKLVSYEVEEVTGAYDAKNDELLIAFIQAKEIEGRSKKTTNRYQYMLERMIKEMGVPVARVTVFHVRAYLMQNKNRGLSDASLEGLRSIMSSFFGWLYKEGLIQSNPVANVAPIKCTKQIKIPFSMLEIELIKQACKTSRERALVSFLKATGCRVGEVCRLDRDSVDFKNLECTVLGKGDKERIVYLDEVASMELERYLSERTDNDPCLFLGQRGRFTEQGVRALLKALEARSGVENVHPHRFRRTLATNLIDRGMAIQEVAFILGHDNINTTMKYVYTKKTSVKASYRKYSN